MNNPRKNERLEVATDQIIENINARLLDTSEFNQLISEWDGDWALVLRQARVDPVNALLELHKNLSRFFERHNVTTNTWVGWLVLAVARSPEFLFAVDHGGGKYEVELEKYCREVNCVE